MKLFTGFLVAAYLLTLTACAAQKTISAEQTAYMQLAEGYLQNRDLDKAKSALEKAGPERSENDKLLHAWAVYYQLQGDLKKSEKLYKQSLGVNFKYSAARNNYGVMLDKQGRHKEALIEFQIAAADISYENRVVAMVNMSDAALKTDDKPLAVEALKKAQTLSPSNPKIKFKLARLHLELKDLLLAQESFQQFVDISDSRELPISDEEFALGMTIARERSDPTYLNYYQQRVKLNREK